MRLQVIADELNVRAGPGTEYEVLDTLKKGDQVDEIEVEGWTAIPMEDGTVGFVSGKYLTVPKPLPPDAPPPVVVTPSGGEPTWIKWARSKVGEHEGENPEIDSWFQLTTLPKSYWDSTKTPWCAVFVNAALLLNGVKSLKSALAVDYLKLGAKVAEPQKGDITVFDWGNGSHHVNFFLSDLGNNCIQCIGGNQSNAVTVATYPTANIMGYRRPV